VTEKIILIQQTISKHTKDKVVIASSQHVFTQGKSRLTNLTVFYDEVTDLVDGGRAVDFSKASDTLP